MKNNTKIRLHLSKQLFESLTKQVIAEAKGKKNFGAGMEEIKAPKAKKDKVEEMETKVAENPKEKEVIVTLNEFYGDQSSYDLGMWALKHFPDIANALKDAAYGDGQEIVDLGNKIVGLATVGTIGLSVGLAAAKDSIKAAAKKLKDTVKGVAGGKGAVSEAGEDSKLADIVAKMPEDVKAKIASK